jgi:TonB family protein
MTRSSARRLLIVAFVCVSTATFAAQTPRVRVGGEVKQPAILKKVQPVYPMDARDKKIGGTVLLDVVIATNGSVLKVDVIKAVYPSIDAAAVAAVRQWKFAPTKLNGKPVEVSLTGLGVPFKLRQ